MKMREDRLLLHSIHSKKSIKYKKLKTTYFLIYIKMLIYNLLQKNMPYSIRFMFGCFIERCYFYTQIKRITNYLKYNL